MKNTIFFMCLLALSSCQYQRIAQFNMVSTRNYETKQNYVLIARDVTETGRMSGSDYTSEIIDEIVDKNKGEYLANVVIYTNGSRIKVTGDVWGLATPKDSSQVTTKKAFTIGERIQYVDKRNRTVAASIQQVEQDSVLIRLLHNDKSIKVSTLDIKR